jgi:hypothetical protein
MANQNTERFRHLHRYGTNPIDALACLAALMWAGVAIIISWWRADVPLLASLQRALVGAIGVYAAVFISLYVMIWMANKTAHGRKIRKAENKEA